MLIPLANVGVPAGHRGSAVRQAEQHLHLRTYLLSGEIGSKQGRGSSQTGRSALGRGDRDWAGLAD